MAQAIRIEVEGLEELRKKMREVGPKLAKKGLRAATNAAAQTIKKEAKALAPIDSGKLAKKAIYVKRSRRGSSASRESYIVGVRVGRKESEKNRDAYYWFMVEFGTMKMAAQPFLRPAFENKKHEAIEKFKSKLREKLNQLVPGV